MSHQQSGAPVKLKNKPMKRILLLLSVLFITLSSYAQTTALTKKSEATSFVMDTISNTTAVQILYPKLLVDRYDLSWHLEFRNLTGTSAGVAVIEGSNCISCNDWEALRTYTFSNTLLDTSFNFENFPMLRVRVSYVPSGTHTTEVKNHLLFRRREE